MLETYPFRKVFIGALIAGAGAALVYLSEQIPGITAGEHGALWGALAATAVNAARQLLLSLAADQQLPPPPPPAKE